MTSLSAGLLMCRMKIEIEFFLVHPGGPYFKKKDDGYWTIPKGLCNDGEELISTAIREFEEETGIKPKEPFHPLGMIKQKSGKLTHAWTFSGNWEPSDGIVSNTFTIEWPPRSGKQAAFPEVDKAEWMNYELACVKINQAQIPFLEKAKEFFNDK